jgi:hypothetical protein
MIGIAAAGEIPLTGFNRRDYVCIATTRNISGVFLRLPAVLPGMTRVLSTGEDADKILGADVFSPSNKL